MKLKHDGKVLMIPVDQIKVGARARPLDPAAVEMMLSSVAETGVIFDPIMVRDAKSGFDLIDGRHRLEIARKTGRDEIEARVWTCTQKEARFMEVTANLSVAHLTPLDFAVNLAERKAVYEDMYPETRAGVAGARRRHGLQPTKMSFADFMAGVLGKDPRHIQRVVAVGEALSADEVRWLRGAPRRLVMDDIAAFSKISDEHERKQVCIALSNGKAKKVAAARRSLAAERGEKPAVKSPREQAYQRLLDAWERAPKDVRRGFVADRYDDLADLVSDECERRER